LKDRIIVIFMWCMWMMGHRGKRLMVWYSF
jgi:hypothetical protein